MTMYSKKYKFSSISNEFWKIYFSDTIGSFEEIKNFIELYKFTKEDLEDIPKVYNEEKKYKDIYTYIQDELDGKNTYDYMGMSSKNQPTESEVEEAEALKYQKYIEENKIESNYDFIFNYAMKKTEKRLEVKKSDVIGSGTWNEGHTPKFFLTLNKILKDNLKDNYSRFIEITKENFMKEEIHISKENFLVSFLEREELEKLLLDSRRKETFYRFIIENKIILSNVVKEVIKKDFESFLNIQIECIEMMFSDNQEKHLFSFDEIDKNNATSLKVLIEFLVSLEESDFQKFESDFLEIISLDVEQYQFIKNKLFLNAYELEESRFLDMSWYFGSEYNISKDDQRKDKVAFSDRRYLNYLFDSNFLDKSMSDLKLYKFIRNKVIDGDRPEEYLNYLLKIDVDKVRKDEDINIEKILEEALTHPKVFIAGFSSYNSHIWELLENDEKYVELLEELKKSESEYVSNSATSSLIRNYEKQCKERSFKNEYYKEIFDEDYSDIKGESVQRPLIITEGKTDWRHLKKALERFHKDNRYLALNPDDFKDYIDIGVGESTLDSWLKSIAKSRQEQIHIFMFDRDTSKYVQEYGKKDFIQVLDKDYLNRLKEKLEKNYGDKSSPNYQRIEKSLDNGLYREVDAEIKNILTGKEYNEWEKLSNNQVYALCIPEIKNSDSPRTLDKICIEFYYKEKDLKTTKDGKRLFFADEFEFNKENNGDNSKRFISRCGKFKTSSRQVKKGATAELTLISTPVYSIDDEPCKNNLLLSKNDFTKYIENEVEGFDNFDIENFRLIFDVIEKIVKD